MRGFEGGVELHDAPDPHEHVKRPGAPEERETYTGYAGSAKIETNAHHDVEDAGSRSEGRHFTAVID